MTLKHLVKGIEGLISLPDAVIRINEVMDSPLADATAIGNVISHEPGLAARLLKIVNSAFYGASTKIESLSKAVTVIGLNELRSMVLASSASEVFNRIPSDLVNMDDFWHRSVYTGLVCRELGARVDFRSKERLFTIGLLHDIGKLVLFHQEPERSAKILDTCRSEGRSLSKLQQEVFGFTDSDVGAELMREWSFPDSLWIPVEYRRRPMEAPKFKMETGLLHIATALADEVEPELSRVAGSDIDLERIDVDPSVWETTGLSQEDLIHSNTLANMNCLDVVELVRPGWRAIF